MEPSTERFVAVLRERGVEVRCPETLDVSPEVDPGRFGRGAVLHAGTRLRGRRTLVSAGAEVGREAPATLDDTMLGCGARVDGGFVQGAVLLDGATIGSAAHVRGGTLLEESARVAHAVGLKQTILLPHATLGSLINFCDCLLAGGSGRDDHSEVGSGFIHFNFTPRGPKGDKATPSLFGDVPRGVLLRSPRIFLGGDGGVVGPLSVGYGAVLAAGATYRRDCPEGVLRTGETLAAADLPFDPLVYGDVGRKWRLNLAYLGNLVALWQWYSEVRLPSAPADDEPGRLLLEGARAVVAEAVAERQKQLGAFVRALEVSLDRLDRAGGEERAARSQRVVLAAWPQLVAWVAGALAVDGERSPAAAAFLSAWEGTDGEGGYLARLRALPAAACAHATEWLSGYVEAALAAGRLGREGGDP